MTPLMVLAGLALLTIGAELIVRAGVRLARLPALAAATIALLVMSLDGEISRADSAALLLGALVYSVVIWRTSSAEDPAVRAEYDHEYDPAEKQEKQDRPETRRSGPAGQLVTSLLTLVVGLGIIVGGAELLVEGAVRAAQALGVSDVVIGLTVVAIGTSAPELATSLIATVRGERDLAVPDDVVRFDLPVLVVASLLCIPVFRTGHRVSRREGGVFVGLYCLYLVAVLMLRT